MHGVIFKAYRQFKEKYKKSPSALIAGKSLFTELRHVYLNELEVVPFPLLPTYLDMRLELDDKLRDYEFKLRIEHKYEVEFKLKEWSK